MSEYRLRQGRKVGRTLYEHTADDPDGRLVGMVDSQELAAEIVQAVNAARDARAGVGSQRYTASYNDCRLGPLRTFGQGNDG